MGSVERWKVGRVERWKGGKGIMNKLIKNARIVTMDDDLGIIDNGYIAIAGDKISYVGETMPNDFVTQVIIDGKNRLVMPGLVNAHTHTPMTLLRSYADDLPLEKWLFEKVFPVEDKLDAEDVYWAAMLSIMEMLSSGITCFADMYFFMDDIARAIEDSGMRAHISRGLQCFHTGFDTSRDKRLIENERLFIDWDGKAGGRIKVGFGPHSVYTCVPDYIEACVELAEKYGSGIHIHLSETQKEKEDCIKTYGKTPVRHLYDLGVFKLNTIAAHCVHVTDEDIDILKESGVNVIYNPGSNLKLGSGIAPIEKMLSRGINVAIGTDGASSNNNLNMFEEMHLASILSKGANLNPESVKPIEVLKMATLNGIKALNSWQSIGEIKPGMKADIIAVNTNKPHFYPLHNDIANLVYSAQASDVEFVMVDGNILMENGEYRTIDFERVIFHIKKSAEKLFI